MQNTFEMFRNVKLMARTKQKTSSTHLVHLVPPGIDCLVDDFALEELCPHLDDSVRIRLAFNQPPKELVFP